MSNAAPEASQTSPDPIANVPINADTTACLDLAAWIGMLSSDDYLRSFTSLLIALLHADNGLSRWFLRVARASGVNLDAIYATRDFRPAILQDIRARRDRGEVPSGKPGWTTSATTIGSGAIELMSQTAASELGVRHGLSAY